MSILCFAEDPGGANGAIALALESSDVILAAEGVAIEYIKNHGLRVQDGFADNTKAVVVGTSQNIDSKAFEYISWARHRNIPSFAYIDACINAEKRFRGHTDDPLFYAPDYLFVTEDATAKAFSDLGFNSAHIFVVGNPRYDFVDKRASTLIKKNRQKKSILFLADPIEPRIGRNYKHSHFEASTAQDIRSFVILDFLLHQHSLCTLMIKLHPRNSADEFKKYKDLAHIYEGEGLGIDLAFQADIVIGTTTSLLVESAIIGVPTISVLLTPEERTWLPQILPDNLILSRDPQHLEASIQEILNTTASYPLPSNKEHFCKNAGQKMLKIIESYLKI